MPEKVNLLKFQWDAMLKVASRNRVAFFLDMGLGKTFVGAEKLNALSSPYNLVICQKTKVDDWVTHFNQYYQYNVIDLTKVKKKDFDRVIRAEQDGITVFVINYDIISKRSEISALSYFTLLLDESSLIQNSNAKWTKSIMSLNPHGVILLSGTPCSGKYENLWTQARLLGWDISEELFKRHFVNFITKKIGRKYFCEVDKTNPYKNVDRLKRKLEEYGAVFIKSEEVVDLPEQNFIEVKVPAPSEYKRFIRKRVLYLDDGTEFVGNDALSLRLRSRMICGYISREKLQAFEDILESTGDRLVVFYNFNAEFDALKKLCEKHERPVSVINGSEKNLDAYRNSAYSVTLIQYQSGSMGLNLQMANRAVYFTLPERSDLFEQSKKRINRIGQERPCFYHVMMCRGTVEESIYEALKQRKDYTDELFRKEYMND